VSKHPNSDNPAEGPRYLPVSCDLVDLIEHYATLGTPVKIDYRVDGKLITEQDLLISTWVNDGEGEYLIFKEGLKVRMDHVKTLNGHSPESSCNI